MITDLARELRAPLATLCRHLGRLSSAGLIRRRRSGAWHYCSPQSPYGKEAFSGQVASWLHEMLRDPRRAQKHYGPGQLRNVSDERAETLLHRTLFDAATAFASVRRLQILRRLMLGDVVTLETLTQELSMSVAAASRHTSKLIRRGYVSATRTGHTFSYVLSRQFKTPLHEKLFEMVRYQWERKPK